jgi:hypothetical protein
MVLLLEMSLAPLLRSTAQKLDIHYYDVFMSCITYTKQLIFYLFHYSSSEEMLDSSDPLSNPLLMDLSIDTNFVLVARLIAEPLHDFGTYVVLKDT